MTDSEAPSDDPAQAAIDALSDLDLADLVYWTVSVLRVPFGEKAVDPSAVACSYALRKVADYLQALREAEDRRYAIGAAVEEDIKRAKALRSVDPDAADGLLQAAAWQNAKTEIEIHFFAVAADQIRRLLAVVTDTLGVDLDESDGTFLFSYRPLRNQFEHLEERLPGVEKGGSIVLHETSAPSVLLGLRKGDVGRITVLHKGKTSLLRSTSLAIGTSSGSCARPSGGSTQPASTCSGSISGRIRNRSWTRPSTDRWCAGGS